MILRRVPRAVVALAVVALPALALAAEPWEGPPLSADPKALYDAATRQPAPADADVEVLYDETTFSFDAQGRQTELHRLVYRLLTQTGVKEWATTGMAYSPWHQTRPELLSRVITAGGQAHVLDPKTISEAPLSEGQPQMFTDARAVRAPLPAMEVGAVVEETVRVRETEPLFAKGVVNRQFLMRKVPTRKMVVRLEAPVELPLKYDVRGMKLSPKVSERDGRRVLVFETGPLPRDLSTDPMQPPDAVTAPRLAFSTGRSWAEVATEYGKLVDRQLAGSGLEAKARELFGDKPPSRQEAADRVLAWMRETLRYTGVELGEGSVVPRTPAETLAHKYGDCKDMAALLVGVLRAGHIPAEVALLRTGFDDSPPNLPGLGLFDHAIVYLPGSPALWIDPTSTLHVAGTLPAGDQGRLALVASPSTTGLIRTPEATSAANHYVDTRELLLAEEGPGRVVETRTATGAIADIYRTAALNHEPQELRDFYERLFHTAYDAKGLDTFDYGDPAEVAKPFSLKMTGSGARRALTTDAGAELRLGFGSLISYLPDSLLPPDDADKGKAAPDEDRTTDLYLTEPYSAELRYRVVPPPGFKARPLPEKVERALGPARFSLEYGLEADGTVLATARFDTVKRRFTPAEAKALKDGVRELMELEPAVGFDSEASLALASGRMKDALESYRKLSALHPKEALHHLQLARALLQAGFGEQARSEARKAVELEPNSMPAHKQLGWILQHDLLGRRFHKGFDYDAAVAEYKKAKALDGQDFESRGDLAILLEHNAKGERFGPGARLEESLAEYRALRDELKNKALDVNFLVVLHFAGRFKELRELAPSVTAGKERDGLWVTAIAASDGPEAAIREAARITSSREDRRAALLSAGQNLLNLRRYADAATLIAEGARGAPGAAAVQAQLALISRAKRHEELSYAENDPRSLVLRAMTLIFTPDLPDEQLGELFSSGMVKLAPKKVLGQALRAGASTGLRQLKKSGVSLDTALDLGLAGFDLTVEGDDARGYKVQLAAPLAGLATKDTWFVVREGGKYRIAGNNHAPGTLGQAAMERLAAGDLPGARRWLDWAHELISGNGAQPLDAYSAFLAVWQRGAQADLETARVAAASLLAYTEGAATAAPILLEARKKATAELATKLDWALANGYLLTERYADLAPVAERLHAVEHGSPRTFELWERALIRGKQEDRAKALAEARLRERPNDVSATEFLMSLAMLRGDFEGATALGESLVAAGMAQSSTYNNLAWYGLFTSRPLEKSLEYAQKANAMTGSNDASVVNTLAAIEAELGQGEEAHQLLIKSLELTGDGDPRPSDWYVLGRIAEGYGLAEAASEAYRHALAKKPGAALPDDVDTLARKRLKAAGAPLTATPAPP